MFIIRTNSSVTSIGSNDFTGCSSLKKVLDHSKITTIRYCSFSECSLKQITIHSSVTLIGKGAFKGCSSLTSISIPSSVTKNWF